jgi:transcriptional regulator with XRE-family HTH domain
MTESAHWLEESFGKRLAAWRRHRGFRTAAALAEEIAAQGGTVSEAVIQNLESGRKADPTVSQLLALTAALGVPPLALLAPLGNPVAHVQLLGAPFGKLPAFQLDGWWSVGERGIDSVLPDVSAEDRDVIRSLRDAVTARAQYNSWRLRHGTAVAAGDRDGALEAYKETMRVVAKLFAASRALMANGLPTDWLELESVHEIERFSWIEDVELPTANPEE